MQVLSNRGARFQRITERVAEACARHPGGYRGLLCIRHVSPDAAAGELERAAKELGFHGVLVNGATDGRFLDDPAFEPILAKAEELDLPIYIHPGIPAAPVRNAYYDNLPGNFSFTFALAAWGWHAETAVHTLRLVFSGALDRHPRLKIVIGLWRGVAVHAGPHRRNHRRRGQSATAAFGAAHDPGSGVDHGPAGSSLRRRSWRR